MDTITGVVYRTDKEEQITDSFKKRLVIIETAGEYPQFIPIEFTQDKCGLLDPIKKGQIVEVGVNIRGNLWTNKEGKEVAFLSFNGWRITPEPVVEAAPLGASDDVPF